MQKDEEAPIGLILCADKSDEHVELLQLGKSGVRVATYLTELPPKEILENKLHQAIMQARKRFQNNPRQISKKWYNNLSRNSELPIKRP